MRVLEPAHECVNRVAYVSDFVGHISLRNATYVVQNEVYTKLFTHSTNHEHITQI